MSYDLDPAKFAWAVCDNADGTVSCFVDVLCFKGSRTSRNLFWKLTWDQSGPKKTLIRRTLYRGQERVFSMPLQ